ncbi:MAG: glycosyltransferase [Paracoccaceae bacterium]
MSIERAVISEKGSVGAGAGRITRLIVTYNSAAVLPWQAEHSARLPCLVVDNASRDDTPRVAERLGYRVLCLGANHGFGRGVMAGLGAVETEYALVLNPDAAIGEIGVARLLTVAERHRSADLFLPRVVDSQGNVHFRHDTSIEPRDPGRHVPDGTACIAMVSGAVMLIRVRPFLDFGGFDPAIFLYFEDDDLALRYRAARRPMIFVPEAEALHLGDQSSGNDEGANRVKDISFGWSRAYLMRKHRRGRPLFCLLGMLAKWPVYLISGRFQRLRRQTGRIFGFWTAVRGRPAPFLPASEPDGTGRLTRP